MIKNLLFLICLLVPALANCQTEKPIKKGNIILGGTGSFNYNKSTYSDFGENDSKQYNINLYPSFNYFLINNLALGATVNLGYTHQENINSKSLGFGPNVKYYFTNGILLRSDASYSLSSSWGARSRSFALEAGAGYAFFINSKVSIEPALMLNTTRVKSTISEREVGGLIIPEVKLDQKIRMFLFEIGFHVFI
jgi:hypothetical protein